MTVDKFMKSNNYRMVKCKCCAFCKFYRGDPYDFGGSCTHPSIIEKHSCLAQVDDFGLCNKFEDN